MDSTGSVGGAGASASNVPAASGAAGATGSTEAVGNPQEGSANLNPTKGAEDTGAHVPNMNMNHHSSNMSCKDFIGLHNQALEPIPNMEETGIDMQKLIELIMAMKLLEEITNSSDSSSGFSTVA